MSLHEKLTSTIDLIGHLYIVMKTPKLLFKMYSFISFPHFQNIRAMYPRKYGIHSACLFRTDENFIN